MRHLRDARCQLSHQQPADAARAASLLRHAIMRACRFRHAARHVFTIFDAMPRRLFDARLMPPPPSAALYADAAACRASAASHAAAAARYFLICRHTPIR